MSSLKEKIKANPKLKHFVLNLIMHPVKTRPRWWVRQLQFLYMKKGKHSVIYRSVRKDIAPFNPFIMGKYSIIEDYSCINNGVGEIIIGDYCRIGLSNTIIGPIHIANGVNISQNVVMFGLNHNYQDITKDIISQGVTTALISIGENTIIGANSIILAGKTIGKHCFIGAGAIVNKDIPDYCVAVGNPIRIIKKYNNLSKKWEKYDDNV
jgi:acetyltransferase-like isoleucine patch superfamily enzyme